MKVKDDDVENFLLVHEKTYIELSTIVSIPITTTTTTTTTTTILLHASIQ
jgi:hypothetical protein